MFKIGEFSKLTQVSIRMLRYYDETGLLKPAETDPDTNYRLYSSAQIPLLNQILFLRDLGFSLTETTAAVRHWNDHSISQLLDHRRAAILDTIKAEQDKLNKIEVAQKDIRQEQIAFHINVAIKSIPAFQVFSLRRVVSDYYAESLLWKEMSAYAAAHQIPVSDHTFTIYHDADYRETDVDIEICALTPLTGISQDGFTCRHTEAVPIMACTMVYGPFENIAGVFKSFAGWLQEHPQYSMSGTSRQIVHRGPWNEENPGQYLTEIQVPLKDRSP